MKKQISMLLATACAASLLAACGGSGSTAASASAADSTAASSEETAADAASLYENAQKPDKLVWWVHDGMHQEDGSEQWIADFDAKTGIDLELDFIDNNEYTKKLELAYASDTVPDTFDLNGETLGNYAAQGAIADLTDLVHESGLYDKVDKNLWDALTVNGKIYGVPRETPSAIVTYVRKDWLDRLGMDVPTTYDEFIEMLTRFKNEIPECTAPYTAPGLKSTQALPEFYQGATADYVKVDGKWVDGMAQDILTGRDLDRRTLYLHEENCIWLLDEEETAEEQRLKAVPEYLWRVAEYIEQAGKWQGTATELLSAAGVDGVLPHMLTRKIVEHFDTVFVPKDIHYETHRTSQTRLLKFSHSENDADDANDADIDITQLSGWDISKIASQASLASSAKPWRGKYGA